MEGGWNFFPAVVEINGNLKDKVHVRGSVEVHLEGSYYLQWREGKSRIRRPVPEKAGVLDLAGRKRLELEARKAGVPLASSTCSRSAIGRTMWSQCGLSMNPRNCRLDLFPHPCI